MSVHSDHCARHNALHRHVLISPGTTTLQTFPTASPAKSDKGLLPITSHTRVPNARDTR